jgi:hypothetical protein
MYRRILTVVLISTGVLTAGGAALAVANSVSTRPEPQFISRTDKSGVSDHPDAPSTTRQGRDDTSVTAIPPVTVDDHGTDNPATHDVADDHGTDASPATSVAPVIVDDHGTDNLPATSVAPVTVDDHGTDSGSSHK